jgi:TPR repeat protein
MKKLLWIIVLGLLWCNTSLANDPNRCDGISKKAMKAMMIEDYPTAFKFANESITKEKEACADFILGTLYFEGWGVEKNQAKGLNYYKLGAEKGHDVSQKFLATAYYKGIGTERNPKKAAKLFKKLAEKNNANGQIYLAYMYSAGDGINRDLILSYMWFFIVSKQYPEPANSEMKKLENVMSAKDINDAIKKANDWLSSK